ncbi:hypothetical protein HMPREF1318_0396 [Actinomyces massiliensis F0489]|uniref:Uncharacterized protein n=1 Tax=Actinomyces massiliensis F0489 TaxID=1125718 RepID=J0WJV0_9ACTO|nr:hypothetical protein HMPREF1318_0396 [Actinomyces massiliensis F0489]
MGGLPEREPPHARRYRLCADNGAVCAIQRPHRMRPPAGDDRLMRWGQMTGGPWPAPQKTHDEYLMNHPTGWLGSRMVTTWLNLVFSQSSWQAVRASASCP